MFVMVLKSVEVFIIIIHEQLIGEKNGVIFLLKLWKRFFMKKERFIYRYIGKKLVKKVEYYNFYQKNNLIRHI